MNRPYRPARSALAVVLAAALGLTACGGESLGGGGAAAEESDEQVRVGLIVAQSGKLALSGNDLAAGFNLYLDQNDGELGGREVDLITVDEGDGPQTGVPAATRLVTQDRVHASVGVISSSVGLAVRTVYDEAKVPLLVANASAAEITSPVSPYVWRTAFVNADIGAVAGPAVQEQVGDGSVYILAQDYAAGRQIVSTFRKEFEAAGGKVAGEAFTPFGTTSDFQPYLSNARQSGASAVYGFYSASEAVNFVKQYQSFGLADTIPLFGPGFLTSGDVLGAEGDAALGIQTVLHYSDQIDTDANREFVEAYQDAYDKGPSSFSEQGYASAAVLDRALADAEDLSGDALSEALGGLGDIETPRGTWRFSDTHDPVQNYFLLKVEKIDGRLVNTVVEELER